MIKVKAINAAFLEAHLARQEKLFSARIQRAKAETRRAGRLYPWIPELIKYYENNFKTIIVGNPQALRKVISEVSRDFPEYSKLCKSKKTITPRRLEKYIDYVNKIFSYDAFVLKNDYCNAYSLVASSKLRICPYCHLAHINFHNSQINGEFEMRPPLDHFYPKDKYPYLAVSAYNLIPSCWQCNSSVKSNADPLPLQIPHPAETTTPLDIGFSIKQYTKLRHKPFKSPDEISILVYGGQQSCKDYVKFFRLEERYQWHTFEAFDLYQKHRRYQELPDVLKTRYSLADYALSFSEKDKEERFLGIFLTKILASLQ